MFIKYKESKEFPKAEIIKEMFELSIIKPAGEADRSVTDIVLIAGDEYKVKHNGSEYNCVAWEEDGVIHIGGESEPFDIYNFAGDIYVIAETDGANTFEVHHEKVKTFDYDVMPKGYPGVKKQLVEIVPEQSVTGHLSDDGEIYMCSSANSNVPDNIVLTAGNKYKVIINGKEHLAVGVDIGRGVVLEYTDYNSIMCSAGRTEMDWPLEYGETITLAIFEQQEVITPIDPKFVGGVLFVTFSDDDDIRYIRHYDPVNNTMGEKVTREELFNAFTKGVIYSTGNYSIQTNAGYIFMLDYAQFPVGEDFAYIKPVAGSNINLFTAEYTESSGPQ